MVNKSLKKSLNECHKIKNGFTLIEILAVVVIIGLIFVLVIPKVANSLRNKKSDVDQTTTNIVISAAKLYVMDNTSKFERVNGNISCMPVSQLVKKGYLEGPVKNVTDDVDITNKKTVQITYNKGFTYEMVDSNDCLAQETKVIRYFADVLVRKANASNINSYSSGDSHQMYTFSHPATEQTTALTDYRFIGDNPYNYVEFNGELWRVIGVFTVENSSGELEQRVKIMKNEFLSETRAWNSSDSNDWPNATLKTYLNGDYYNSLADASKPFIDDVKYYLSACRTDAGDGSAYYSCERSNIGYSSRVKNWIGKLAIMYPSDYIYTFSNGVDNPCFQDVEDCSTRGGVPTKSWMFNINGNKNQWLLTLRYTSLTGALSINNSGDITGLSSVILKKNINPVIYLSKDTAFKGGTGKQNKPYKIKINQS